MRIRGRSNAALALWIIQRGISKCRSQKREGENEGEENEEGNFLHISISESKIMNHPVIRKQSDVNHKDVTPRRKDPELNQNTLT
jgi:hypothetical protein